MEHYQQAREHYRRFVAEQGITMGGSHGWQRFIQATSRTPEGRAAFLAYREQKRLAHAAPAKLHLLGAASEQHRQDRVLIFTYDNATVYQIARRFLVPAITHQTQDEGTPSNPAPLPQRRVSGPGDQPGAQRGRGRTGRQRGHHLVGHRQRARTRAAAWAVCSASTATSRRCFTRSSRAAPRRSSPATDGGNIRRISRAVQL